MSLKKTNAQFVLEILNSAGYAGLRDKKALGGFINGTVFGNLDEIKQLLKGHGYPLLNGGGRRLSGKPLTSPLNPVLTHMLSKW